MTCTMCGGKGEVVAGHPCPRCGGSGKEQSRSERGSEVNRAAEVVLAAFAGGVLTPSMQDDLARYLEGCDGHV